MLHRALVAAVAPLDYRLLNERIEEPNDENIANWVRARLEVPGLQAVRVQTTAQRGTEIGHGGAVRFWRRYALQAAHRLPNVPAGHKCARVHGHGFEVVLCAGPDASTDRQESGYETLDAAWAPLHAELEHRYMNEVPGLENPTSEMLAGWLWARIRPGLPGLVAVAVYETGQSGATFDGARYGIWKEFGVDAAVRLPAAPPDDPRRRLHGHSYVLRLHLSAPLDGLLGWTVDFGDVKSAFDPVFERIDHGALHELPGLERADPASLAQWLRHRTLPALPQLDRIDLYETHGCGAELDWGGREVVLPV